MTEQTHSPLHLTSFLFGFAAKLLGVLLRGFGFATAMSWDKTRIYRLGRKAVRWSHTSYTLGMDGNGI